ncbi:hypothetical protein AMD02_001560 [Halalkalibacterium halodurans]|nr:hypothetical protein AMD02_001560 [Halalkalibacterium halodurans]
MQMKKTDSQIGRRLVRWQKSNGKNKRQSRRKSSKENRKERRLKNELQHWIRLQRILKFLVKQKQIAILFPCNKASELQT